LHQLDAFAAMLWQYFTYYYLHFWLLFSLRQNSLSISDRLISKNLAESELYVNFNTLPKQNN